MTKRIMAGTREEPGDVGGGDKENEWWDRVADDIWVFGIENGKL